MQPFNRQFGVWDPSTQMYILPTNSLALLNSLPVLGQATGIVIAGLIMNIIGRKWSNFAMCFWSNLGAAIMIAAKTWQVLLVARMISYIYYGAVLVIVSAYMAELVPEQLRGIAIGSYMMSFVISSTVMTGVQRGTSTLNSNAAWQIPFGLFFIMPTMICIVTPWLPESPRYLCMRGRYDEAHAILKKCRVKNDDVTIDEEIGLIKLALEADAGSGKWSELFKGTNLRRTALVCAIGPAQTATGNSFTSQYGAIFVASLKSLNVFDVGLIGSGIGLLCTGWAMLYLDKIGRRKMIIACSIWQACVLAIQGGVAVNVPVSSPRVHMIIACNLLFNASYNAGFSSAIHALVAEIPQQRLRAKSQLMSGICTVAVGLAVSYITPYLIDAGYANLQAKTAFVFLPINFLVALMVYWYFPEVKGRSLEEIDLMFMMKISARDSVTWKPESTAAGLISLTAEPKEAITVEEAENKVAEFGASEKAEIEQVERTPAAPRTELSV